MTPINWKKWEVVRGSVTKDECKSLGLSYVFHIDREYLSDIGCLLRVNLCGWTIEVYEPYGGAYREPDKD